MSILSPLLSPLLLSTHSVVTLEIRGHFLGRGSSINRAAGLKKLSAVRFNYPTVPAATEATKAYY